MSIQDSSFHYSYLVSPARMILLYLAIIPILMAGFISAIMLVIPLWDRLGLQSDPRVAMVVVAGITLATAAWAVRRYIRRRGYVSLAENGWQVALDKIFAGIAGRKSVTYGTLLIRCGDSFWREAVARAVTKASAVVVDVGDLSENIAWELQTVLEQLPPACVVLAFPAQDNGSDNLPDTIKSRLDAIAKPAIIEACQLLSYHAHVPSHGGFGLPRYSAAKTKELRRKLILAIETRPPGC